ncbi:MAG: M24 family metallopeptidase, partial [Halobacteriales archaeon]
MSVPSGVERKSLPAIRRTTTLAQPPDGIEPGNIRVSVAGAHTFMPPGPDDRSMTDEELVREKVAQARSILADAEADAWLTFARETAEIREPALPYLLGFDVVWPTMVLVAREESTVVIGRHDAPNAELLGVHDVVAYDESLAGPFHDWLERVDPEVLAVNYSKDDNVADGLTHGMYRRLVDLLEGTGYEDALASAEPIVERVRGIKTETERARIEAAAETTEGMFDELAAAWGPDWREADVAAFLHGRMNEEGYGAAWSWDYCPTVHAGGDAPVGHTLPGDRTVPPGELLHVDFGVVRDGYAADLQRMFYRPDGGEGPPAGLRAALQEVRSAIRARHEDQEPG